MKYDNIVNFTWNLKNLTLEDFGLYEEYNMLTAPTCPCGCGEKAFLILEDEQDVIDTCYSLVYEEACMYCGVFAITNKNIMIAAIKHDDQINVIKSKKPLDDYTDIGGMFEKLELHMFGLIVCVGNDEYRIVEE